MPVYYYDGEKVDTMHKLNFADVVGDGELLRRYQKDQSIEPKLRTLRRGHNIKPTALDYWEVLHSRYGHLKKVLTPTERERYGNMKDSRSDSDSIEKLPPRNPALPRKMPKFRIGEEVLIHNLDTTYKDFEGHIGVINSTLTKHGRYEVLAYMQEEEETEEWRAYTLHLRADQVRVIPKDILEVKKAEKVAKFESLIEKAKESLFRTAQGLQQNPDDETLQSIADKARDSIVFFRHKIDEIALDRNLKRLAGPMLNQSMSQAEKMSEAEEFKGALADGWDIHIDPIAQMVYYSNNVTGMYLRDRPIKLDNIQDISPEKSAIDTARRRERERLQKREIKIAARRARGKGGSETGDTEENPMANSEWLKYRDTWLPLGWEQCRPGIEVRFAPEKKSLDRSNYMRDVRGNILGPWRYGESNVPEGQRKVEPGAEVLVSWEGGFTRAHPLDVLIYRPQAEKKKSRSTNGSSQRVAY
uniref:Uncharacterized protein n=1 Tax=Amorphochlora amoebiformis TaxID=1561963 RepID=A0A7S0GYY1_9EUKA